MAASESPRNRLGDWFGEPFAEQYDRTDATATRGGILTVTFSFFFGTLNLRAQTLMTAMLTILIFSELLTIVVIDRPFSGPVRVEPLALTNVLADFAPAPASATGPSERR